VTTFKETRSETSPDAGVLDAFQEACYTTLAFLAAVAAIQLLKKRNNQNKIVRNAASKSAKLNLQFPSSPLECSGALSTLADEQVATPSTATPPSTRSRASSVREPRTPMRTQSGGFTAADKLVAAVRAGKAAELPVLMDAARMRLVDSGADKEAVQATSAQNLMSALRACAAHHSFEDALNAYDHAKDHIGHGCGSMWSLLLYSAVEAKQFERCGMFFKQLLINSTPSPNDFLNMVRYHVFQKDAAGLKQTLSDLRHAQFHLDAISRNRALSVCFANQGTGLADILVDKEYCDVAMDIVGYNTVLKGYAKLGELSRCFETYEKMQQSGLPSSEVTFGILLDVCIEGKAFDRAKDVFNDLRNSTVKMNAIHYTTFMKGLIHAGQLEEATNLLDEMIASPKTKPDLVTYSTLVKAHADSGRVMEAIRVLERMIAQGITPDAIIFNIVLTGCTVCAMDAEQIFHVFDWLVKHGLHTSTTTLSILVKALAKGQAWDAALEMLKDAQQRMHIWPEPRLFAQLAQAVAKVGNGAKAVEAYKAMVEAAAAQGTAVDEATNVRLLRLCTGCGETALATKIYKVVATAGGYPTPDSLVF